MSNIVNADDYLIKIFQHCTIVGLGEGFHGLENSHKFFHMIFDNKKLQKIINIVILEFANVDYQGTLDKYIFGEDIYIKDIYKIWQESTQSPNMFGEQPVYFELLQKIRNINLTLPEGNKIRVLAGDPSIDWKSIHKADDYFCSVELRNIFPAQLAIDYGLVQNLNVLLIYGGYHLTKISNEALPATHWSITAHVNKKQPGAMKVIEVLNPQALHLVEQTQNWPLYSILDLSDSYEGNLPAETLFSEIYDNKGEKVILYQGYKIRDVFDALLYVGSSESWIMSEIPKSIFADKEYLNELNRRRQIIGWEPFSENL